MQRQKPGIGARKKLTAVLLVLVLLVPGLGVCLRQPPTADAKNIIKGDTRENIKLVQQRLANLGYYTYKVDGLWGTRTKTAVKNFQKASGLVADGIVGARTEKALGVTLKGGAPSSGAGGSLSSSDKELLARCVYAEARGEPYTGQVAIAAVVLNRVRNSAFPNTVSGVIYQPLAFTAVADGQINLKPNDTSYKAAQDALNGWDPTNGCLYYYNPATATSKWIWSLKVELKIGRHSFARGQ
ncbi:MAG: spore cortex-lytic enzyme [Clostridiales bacterium]|jgi:N-acetylmuramoyl-L-alanine amidase|nr:spore cortex-lytic enzyme [Clostridiales bacterium]